jgi:2-polyprenyl-6-methoxyphenol hydroxylase-like FAD-dependent oxidoreductase
MTDHYDVIVIGSGAGGGTLTHALAPAGKRILLLERGKAGYSYLGARLGISAVAHQNGTVRFGTDPASSALDLNCKMRAQTLRGAAATGTRDRVEPALGHAPRSVRQDL